MMHKQGWHGRDDSKNAYEEARSSWGNDLLGAQSVGVGKKDPDREHLEVCNILCICARSFSV